MSEIEINADENLKILIAKNLVKYRKAAKLTQIELADRLLYSDKNISKWERGESVPDIVILKRIADIYGISVNEFLVESDKVDLAINEKKEKREKRKFFSKQQILIVFLSISLVWLVAVVAYSLFVSLLPSSSVWAWEIFILALAVSSIVATVFSSIWCTNLLNCINVSLLIWTVALALFVCIPTFSNNWLIFIIAIPLQILDIFWFIFRKLNKNLKKLKEQPTAEIVQNENSQNVETK
jgi:transcriptional regulator with XRE-family HTH domain